MATGTRKTDEVLASARKDLQAQLGVVRDELARLAGEEQALTRALSTLDGGGSARANGAGSESPRPRARGSRGAKRAARKPGARGRSRGKPKSTAGRVEELRGLLTGGPKSRTDLAAALKVSPARVQQLLGELGSSVSSQAAPGRQGKLWSLKAAGGNGASAAKATSKSAKGKAKRTSTRKPAAAKAPVAK